MQLDQIQTIGAQSFQAPLDARQQRGRPPVLDARRVGMTALREQVEILAPVGRGLADQLLTLHVTLGGIDDVESGIEGAVQQVGDRLRRRFLEADLGAAKPQHAHAHVGLTQLTRLHEISPVLR